MLRVAASIFLAATMATGLMAAEEGLVGYWTFDEGAGTTVHDQSGEGNHGAVRGGARFVPRGGGYALALDGKDDYVDCGNGASLDLTGAVTLEAWIKPDALPGAEPLVMGKYFDSYGLTHYRDGNFWFYISGGGNNAKGRAEVGVWSHVVATFDGTEMAVYVNHQQVDRHASKSREIAHGGSFLMGLTRANPSATDPGYGPTSFWRGMLDNVRVYNRALTQAEVIAHYKAEAGGFGVETAWFDRVQVSLYPSRTEPRMVAVLDASKVFGRPDGCSLQAVVTRQGGAEPVLQQTNSPLAPSGKWALTLDLGGLPAGDYEVSGTLRTPDGKTYTGAAPFRWPPPELQVAPPTDGIPMPVARPVDLPYTLEVHPGGGMTLTTRGVRWPIESSFSYPNDADNRLTAGAAPRGGWRVEVRRTGERTWEVSGHSRLYSLKRTVRLDPQRVYVTDVLHNESAEDVGIIYDHALNAGARPYDRSWVAGYPSTGERRENYNASVFAAWAQTGIGILPLDDLAIIQSTVYAQDDRLGFRNDRLGLPPGESHTFEWAIYPVASTDYFDFINRVRRDENRNRITVEGGFAFVPRQPFSREYAEMRNLLYASFGCLTNVADDPEIEIEGIDFLWLPKERARIRAEFEAIREINPHLKLMFHVAHTLISTNKPTEVFPDSRVLGPDGEHLVWPYDYMSGGYFSKQRGADGWKWYAYYPTPGNSFHDALLRSVDSMVDDIGCNGAFMDGFFCGYVSPWTYDRWDGRTVEMDPQTHTIKRKYASVLWLSQPSMVEFVRRMAARGAVAIANNTMMTRTIGSLPIIVDQECRAGPDVHLAQTPCSLGNPMNIRSEADVYDDVLEKLRWGNLYFYYGEGQLTYPSLPQQQYPITVEALRAGAVRGRERIVTMNSGDYAWPGDHDLHLVHRYNCVGVPIPAEFTTTCDRAGVRTRVRLAEKESAVVVRVPVQLEQASSVNLVLSRYDAGEVRLTLNGNGAATLLLRDGAFPIRSAAAYALGDGRTVTAGADAVLRVPLTLTGQQTVTVRPL
ncbi:MAG: LamG domain-containing protein [Armatimonadetes bacterium]|nr:LamG domain-containing protein [Armatimonadota bacterium]